MQKRRWTKPAIAALAASAVAPLLCAQEGASIGWDPKEVRAPLGLDAIFVIAGLAVGGAVCWLVFARILRCLHGRLPWKKLRWIAPTLLLLSTGVLALLDSFVLSDSPFRAGLEFATVALFLLWTPSVVLASVVGPLIATYLDPSPWLTVPALCAIQWFSWCWLIDAAENYSDPQRLVALNINTHNDSEQRSRQRP